MHYQSCKNAPQAQSHSVRNQTITVMPLKGWNPSTTTSLWPTFPIGSWQKCESATTPTKQLIFPLPPPESQLYALWNRGVSGKTFASMLVLRRISMAGALALRSIRALMAPYDSWEDIWAFGSKTISSLPIKVDINFETRVGLTRIRGKLLSSHNKTLKHSQTKGQD